MVRCRQDGGRDPARRTERNGAGELLQGRGRYPKQVDRWRQATEDANGPSAPRMDDQREVQRKNQELIRRNRQLERELQKKEKALTEAATLLMRRQKRS